MIALLIALVTALSHEHRIMLDPNIGPIIEYVTPSCPSFDDEPCYIIIRTGDVGP